MGRFASRYAVLAVLAAAAPAVQAASHPASHGRRQAAAAAPAGTGSRTEPGQPPHAWLFGTWTGGLFPAPSDITAEACLAQPVVIFTRDIVLRASLTEQLYVQRIVETALATPTGTQFRFAGAAGGSPFGAGFGCSDPDALVVERKTENQISFPGCGDYLNPLVRCPSR